MILEEQLSKLSVKFNSFQINTILNTELDKLKIIDGKIYLYVIDDSIKVYDCITFKEIATLKLPFVRKKPMMLDITENETLLFFAAEKLYFYKINLKESKLTFLLYLSDLKHFCYLKNKKEIFLLTETNKIDSILGMAKCDLLGNITFATVKMLIQIFLCVGMGCVTYFSCIREHPFQTNIIEVNNNENNEKKKKNFINEKKSNEIKENEINIEKENKDDLILDNKNNESKDESFELEENKENERMFRNFISCPKSKFFIYFSIISFFLFNFIDVILISFGVFKDKYGEKPYLID